MKNDFDNLTLRYLSIYNEGYSSEYGEDKRHYTPDQQRALDKVMSQIKITDGSHEQGDERGDERGDAKSMLSSKHYSDSMSWESEYGHENSEARAYLKQKRNEDNESEYGDHYRNDANGPTIEDDCEECGNGGCVDINGHCHYCNLEDEDEYRDEDNENYRPYHT